MFEKFILKFFMVSVVYLGVLVFIDFILFVLVVVFIGCLLFGVLF